MAFVASAQQHYNIAKKHLEDAEEAMEPTSLGGHIIVQAERDLSRAMALAALATAHIAMADFIRKDALGL